MNYAEFVEKINNLNTETCYEGYVDGDSVKYEWITGGQSGGSCWGTDNYHSVPGDPEPMNTILDAILETITPQISFMQYKKLQRLWVVDDKQDNDYYGNYTVYAIKRMALRQLYDELNRMNLLGE